MSYQPGFRFAPQGAVGKWSAENRTIPSVTQVGRRIIFTALFMDRLRQFLRSTPRGLLAIAAIVLLLLGVGLAYFFRSRENPALTTPALALEKLAAKSLYYDGPARPFLLRLRPDLLTADDKQDGSERVRSFVQAVQDPKLFRQLDRQIRFDTLLLVGNPSEYQLLLDHLLESKDWNLAYLDHTSIVFKRMSEATWNEAMLAPIRARVGGSKRDQVKFLAAVATKLVAVRQNTLGKKLADEASQLDPKAPEVWSALAQYHLARGEWNPAVGDADRALEIDEDFIDALAAKSQALFASKHFVEAYRVSDKLLAHMPEDPAILFYHAKICHEAHAFKEEIQCLTKLIAKAEANGRPTSGYRVYLGQAYARDGQGPESLAEYGKALDDPELPSDQRKEVESVVAKIKNRIGAE